MTVDADSSASIALSASDANADDILTFIILALPANGSLGDPGAGPIAATGYTVTANGHEVTYTPNPGFEGEDSFTFAASDGQLESQPATVSVRIITEAPAQTFDAEVTVESLNVAAGTSAEITNNAVVTVSGDATVDGTLFARSGRIRLRVGGNLTINGTIRAVDAEGVADDEARLADQTGGIQVLVGSGVVTIGSTAVFNASGPILITDDEALLERTPAEMFDEVEDVSADTMPTLVPLPEGNPAFGGGAPGKVNIGPRLQDGVLPPVTVSGVWPPGGAPPPPGDRPILILRFNGARDLNLDNWTVNGPAAPAGAAADQTADPGANAGGARGRDGLRLNIRNDGGPIRIVNNVVFNLANGGDGGAATSVCATATGGNGGNSGNARLTAAGGIDISEGTLTINPGRGGNGGEARVELGASGAAGCPGQTGRSATATGGRGGDNTKQIFVRGNVEGLANVVIGSLDGGFGGDATAFGCDGGEGDSCCDGGAGGSATATGGRGGSASLVVGDSGVASTSVTGGDGGESTAFGGNGGDGGGCKLEDGGDGGGGGKATSIAGAGGGASHDAGPATGGNGGDANSLGGEGGNGGDSGLGDPGIGGAGGVGVATAGGGGAAAAAGSAGEATPVDGEDGADGGDITVTLYCIDFRFLGEGSDSLDPGEHEAPVFDTDDTTQLGTVTVTFVDEFGASFARSDTPVSHVGLDGATLEIDVSSLALELPSGVVSGLQIAPLYGVNIAQARPLEIHAFDRLGQTIGTRAFTEIPDNQGSFDDPTPLNAEFAVEESVTTFRIVVPPQTFVTIIRIYLVDP